VHLVCKKTFNSNFLGNWLVCRVQKTRVFKKAQPAGFFPALLGFLDFFEQAVAKLVG